LIGFAGAPWTIFSYMLEGSGSKTFSKARKFLYQNPIAAHLLLEKITQTTIAYLQQKVRSGANMIQVFDSWAGILPPDQYSEFAIPYIKRIVDAIEDVPVIVFAKGAWLDCQVLGVDWNTKVSDLRGELNVQQVLQGNLDPCLLYSSQENVRAATLKMLNDFGGKHIANLGHGVYPDTPLESVKTFVNTVKGYSY
jgi:uroporphyrinogen decarboxylase